MRKEILVGLVVVLAIAVTGGYIIFNKSSGTSSPLLPFSGAEITLSNAPALDQTATLTFTATPISVGHGGTEPGIVRIVLENGFEWVDDNILENWGVIENMVSMENDPMLSWALDMLFIPETDVTIEGTIKGAIINLTENVPFEFNGVIKSIKTGRWNIEAVVAGPGIASYPRSALNVLVSENSAQVYAGYYRPWMENENIQPLPIASASPPLSVSLSFSDSPALNREVDLFCTIQSTVDISEIMAKIELPDTFAVISGSENWRDEIRKDSNVELRLKVKPIEIGESKIKAFVESISDEYQYKDISYLYVNVRENDASVSLAPSQKLELVELPESQIPPEYKETTPLQLQHSSLTITGRLFYLGEDDIPHPLKWMKIKIHDKEWWGSSFLGETLTQNDGTFVFGPISNEDSESGESGTLDIVVEVVAQNGIVDVKGPNAGTYYATWYDEYDVPDGVLPLGNRIFGADEIQQGVGRIVAYVNEAGDYLKKDPIQYEMPQVIVCYPDDGDFYVPSDKHISISQGGAGHPDTARHEYGHFIMHKVYDWWWPSINPQHGLFQSVDQSTAWGEGWANFFALAVEPDGRWITTDVEYQMWTDGRPIGDTVEGRVAGALYDIFDNAEDNYEQWGEPNYDYISLGFKPIWDVLLQGADPNKRQDNFRDFWDAFKSTYSDNTERIHFAKAALYQNTIDYNDPPTVTITQITGQVTGPPIVSATPDDPEAEDDSYLGVEFEYSLNGTDWIPLGKDFVPPYSYALGLDNCPQVWVRATAWDGMENSGWSETGPFSVG